MAKKDKLFPAGYFEKGPYKGAKIEGLSKYSGKYYWARRFYAKLIARLTEPGGSILETGCGFGDLLAFLENEFDCTGTDISRDAIERAKQKLKRTKLLVLPSEEIEKLGREKFNTVAAAHVLEHLKNPGKVIAKVQKVLKKGGIFFAVIPDPDSITRKLKGDNWIGFSDPTHISLYGRKKWQRLFEENGFEIEKKFSDGMWDSPYIPVIPVFLQRIVFGLAPALQTVTTAIFIPPGWGESVIYIARKK